MNAALAYACAGAFACAAAIAPAFAIDRADATRVAPPTPGYYRTRLVKDGPRVAARIEYGPGVDPDTGEPMDRSWMWTATVNGTLIAEPSPDPWAAGCDRVARHGKRIDVSEYAFLLAAAGDARWPEAHPRRPIDLTRIPPVTP